jgi:CRP-like cAMP-binding protein
MMDGEAHYLFQGLGDATRGKILASGREESHSPGNVIFRENEPALNFYILNSGRLRLRAGQRPLLAHVACSVGDVIGWSSLVGNPTYSASAECMTAARVLRIPKQVLDEILAEDPVSGMHFFKHLTALVGQRLVRSYLSPVAWDEERPICPAA